LIGIFGLRVGALLGGETHHIRPDEALGGMDRSDLPQDRSESADISAVALLVRTLPIGIQAIENAQGAYMTTKKRFLIKSIAYRFFRAKFGLVSSSPHLVFKTQHIAGLHPGGTLSAVVER
jgi:hypothetical protein